MLSRRQENPHVQDRPRDSLPYALLPFNLPGCDLNVSLDIAITAANAGGSGRLQMRVPTNPALLGQDLYVQAMVRDAGLPGLGFALSPGLAVTVGSP